MNQFNLIKKIRYTKCEVCEISAVAVKQEGLMTKWVDDTGRVWIFKDKTQAHSNLSKTDLRLFKVTCGKCAGITKNTKGVRACRKCGSGLSEDRYFHCKQCTQVSTIADDGRDTTYYW
jgi:hypothetical protein